MAREINLGADATDADYQIRDSSATGGDFIIEHLPTGATFEYNATSNKWQPTDPIDLNAENLDDGATTVYDASTDTVGDGTNTSADHTSVSTESLVIGGTLYEEDDNSPIATGNVSSTTFTLDAAAQEVVVIPDHDELGFDQLQINGNTTSDYTSVDNADSQTTGQSEWPIPFASRYAYLHIFNDRGANIRLHVASASENTGATVSGAYTGGGGDIASLTFKDSGGTNHNIQARVYRRVMSV